ncbi:hypothetical protein [Trinickia sp.]|uniref:hypothetical protein n=1 Tax=Trinickia sp. TaxID=2571163 RepID=UPI003F807F71
MTIAAIVPAINAVGALATLATSVVSALSGSSDAKADGAAGLPSSVGSNQMDRILKRQEAMQLKAMEMQTEANIQKMMVDTANSIASGHLDSGAKAQNAGIKAAQGIHF